MRRVGDGIAHIDQSARVDARRVQFQLFLLHHVRRRAGDQIRLPGRGHHQRRAVGAKRHDLEVHGQHVLFRPGVRAVRLAEVQVFPDEAGHHAVGQRDQAFQVIGRRVPVAGRQHLGEVVERRRIDVVRGRGRALFDEEQVGAGGDAVLELVDPLLRDVAAGRRQRKAGQRDGQPGLPVDLVTHRARLGFLAEVGDVGIDPDQRRDVA